MPDRTEPLAFTSVGPLNAVGASPQQQRGGASASARFSGWSFFSNVRDSGGFSAPERAPIGEGGRGGASASDRFTISTLPGEVGSKGVAPLVRKGARRADALEGVTPSARRVAPDTAEMAARITPEVTPVFNQAPAAASYRFSSLFLQRARMSAMLRGVQGRTGADIESAPSSSEPLGKSAGAAAAPSPLEAGEARASPAKKALLALALVLCMTLSIFLIVNPGGALTLRGVASVDEFLLAAQPAQGGNLLIVQQENNAVSGTLQLIVSNTGENALIDAIEGQLFLDGTTIKIARVQLGGPPGPLKVPVDKAKAGFVPLRVVQDGALSAQTLQTLKTRCAPAQDGADAQLTLTFTITVKTEGTPSSPITITSLSGCRYNAQPVLR